MTLRDYIESLDQQELHAFAGRCGIAISYMRLHVKYARKDPSVSLIRALTRESQGEVSLADVLQHYNIVEATATAQAA
jgi:hypothetical protein